MAADDAYKKALKDIENMIKKQETLKKSTDDLRNAWSSVSSELFKIDGASFWKEVKKTPAEIKKIGEEIVALESDFEQLGKKLGESLDASAPLTAMKGDLRKIFEEAKSSSSSFTDEFNKNLREAERIIKSTNSSFNKTFTTTAELSKYIEDNKTALGGQLDVLKNIQKLNDENSDYTKSQEKYQKQMLDKWNELKSTTEGIAHIDESIATQILSQIAAGKEYEEILKATGGEGRELLVAIGKLPPETAAFAEGMNNAANGVAELKKSVKETNKEFSMTKGLVEGIGQQIKGKLFTSLTHFDDTLHNVQKTSGIVMDTFSHSQRFSDLTIQATKFGVSVEQAGQMMTDMSTELRTTNFGVLSKAAEDFMMIEGATGAAAGDITNIAGELMRMGESSAQVKDFMQGADQEARRFGVSSSKVLGGISKNIKKMREMGFTGGEKSLTKMAITAERLRMNMDETFDMAKKARNIEGAMDMAAELQLAGGSFANINPMDLLSAARKGPAELQKILTGMGKDIGHFDKETQKYQFDPVDVDRLQMVSDATGQSMESLQNMIEKNAEDTEKLNPFQGMIDGLKEADKDVAKSALSDMMKRGKDGKMEIDVDSDMAKKMGVKDLAQITPEIMDNILKQKQKDAKTLEEQNKRNQSLSKSWDNFIGALTSVMSAFQPFLEILTWFIQGATSIFTEIASWGDGWGKWFLAGLVGAFALFGTNVTSFITKGVGGLGGLLGKIKNKALGMVGLGAKSEGEGDTGDTGGKKGMDMAKSWEGIKNSISKVAAGIKDSIGGIFTFIKDIAGQILTFVGDIIKQILDLATRIVDGLTTVLQSASRAIGVVQQIVGQLVSIVTKSFISLMTALGEGITAFASAAAVGLGILTPFIPIILVLTVAIIGLAFAFKLFAEGLASLAPLITAVFNGIATVVLAVGTAVSMVISTIADSILKLSTIDAGSLFALAAGLGVLSVAMIAFGAAAMIGGVMSFFGGGMFSQLSELALIAPAIKILADSLNSAGDGLSKLSAAAESLSLEKLEKLKELSEAMAGASGGGNAMAAMANVANAAGGTGGATETRKLEIDIKLNGRDVQYQIVKDTAIIK